MEEVWASTTAGPPFYIHLVILYLVGGMNMKGYEGIEKDIWNAIRGLTSGVLTSLICGMLSSNSYELIFNGEK